VGGITPPNRSTPAAKPAAGPESFASSSALEEALRNLPASRADAVAEARAFLADPNYPSQDTLRQVSNLLARNFMSAGE
jgi:2,4-dienoyl-CoA reductase-like NADH-dependent reductase (Old Yellow Enzyme family)